VDGSPDKKGTKCVFDSGEGVKSRFWNPKFDEEDGKGETREECLGKGVCCFSVRLSLFILPLCPVFGKSSWSVDNLY
jgi:hypothetical protein